MQESKSNPHVLKHPTVGPQQELSPEAAYLAAVTSLPRLIHEQTQVLASLVDELNGVHDKLDVISLYFERKGTDEKLFGPEDLLADESPESKGEGNEPPIG
jgi:hypothetical protein